jgi:hypothetical protein
LLHGATAAASTGGDAALINLVRRILADSPQGSAPQGAAHRALVARLNAALARGGGARDNHRLLLVLAACNAASNARSSAPAPHAATADLATAAIATRPVCGGLPPKEWDELARAGMINGPGIVHGIGPATVLRADMPTDPPQFVASGLYSSFGPFVAGQYRRGGEGAIGAHSLTHSLTRSLTH